MKQWWPRQRKKVKIKLQSALSKADTFGASIVYQVSVRGVCLVERQIKRLKNNYFYNFYVKKGKE